MQDSAAPKVLSTSDTQQITRFTGNIIGMKLWLPRFLYDVLPYFYIAAGISAFLATLYISEWFWVLPHYLLFSAACVHLGIIVHNRRQPHDKPPTPDDADCS